MEDYVDVPAAVSGEESGLGIMPEGVEPGCTFQRAGVDDEPAADGGTIDGLEGEGAAGAVDWSGFGGQGHRSGETCNG